jgi:hypothetical protein
MLNKMKAVIPQYPVNNNNNNIFNNNPLRQMEYRPPCSQYSGVRAGGVIYTPNSVFGNCSPNSGGQFGSPYDFVCDANGRNCVSPQGNSSIYYNVDTFCCKSGNSPNNSNNYIFNQFPPPLRPYHSTCCNLDLNSCAKCLTKSGFVSSSNESANHFSNMQICKNNCMRHKNAPNLLY